MGTFTLKGTFKKLTVFRVPDKKLFNLFKYKCVLGEDFHELHMHTKN